MKYEVIKDFTDKHTYIKYKVGDVIKLTKERAKEILEVGELITKVKTTKRVVE
jgi:hypothetical protein